jgi:superoxide dismutase, Fe-Mn family
MQVGFLFYNLKHFCHMKPKILIILFVAIAASFSYATYAQAVKVKPAKSQTTPKPADKPAPDLKTDVKGKPMLSPVSDVKITEWSAPAGELGFPALPYEYNQLEPVIDKLTVEIHYSRHHRAYYDNFKKAVTDTEFASMSIFDIFAKISDMPVAIRNNGGGFYNHVLYWENMSPKGGGEPSGELAELINKQFGGYKEFVEKFNDAAKSRFGSGWAWLSVDPLNGELFISSTANQDNPLMNVSERKGIPILALDVWEHAYYLQYQNKRADYITEFWKIVNWPVVEKRFRQAKLRK